MRLDINLAQRGATGIDNLIAMLQLTQAVDNLVATMQRD